MDKKVFSYAKNHQEVGFSKNIFWLLRSLYASCWMAADTARSRASASSLLPSFTSVPLEPLPALLLAVFRLALSVVCFFLCAQLVRCLVCFVADLNTCVRDLASCQ